MPPRREGGLRDGRAGGRVPGDRGRSGDGHQPRLIQRPGLRLAAGPRNAGVADRRVRTLSAGTLNDMGVRENARTPAVISGPLWGVSDVTDEGVFDLVVDRFS
jgi:hypothetical protein